MKVIVVKFQAWWSLWGGLGRGCVCSQPASCSEMLRGWGHSGAQGWGEEGTEIQRDRGALIQAARAGGFFEASPPALEGPCPCHNSVWADGTTEQRSLGPFSSKEESDPERSRPVLVRCGASFLSELT